MIKPYFQNQSVTLYHGDCFDILPTFEPGSFDAAITDPPYGIGACEWDVKIDCAALHAAMRTVCKSNAAKVLFSNMRFACRLIAGDENAYRLDLIYEKALISNPFLARVAPLRAHENILVFYDRKPTYNPQMWQGKPISKPVRVVASENYDNKKYTFNAIQNRTSRFPTSIIKVINNTTTRTIEGAIHPTQKPVALMEWLIKTYSNSGDMVLDPFAGSGSTGIAAMRTGRKAVLIELEERFCELSAKRLEKDATA